jgi:hypothetical protein
MKILIPIMLLFCISCITNKKTIQPSGENQSGFEPVFASGPPVLVYKTKADYNNLVPVILSDDKSQIVSYPHQNDIKMGNGYQMPVILHDNYLLDNRGIGANVAFIKLTYQEYANLDKIPSISELYNLIVDKDPLIELCDCGIKTAFTDQPKQLNELIDNNKLRTVCKIIK